MLHIGNFDTGKRTNLKRAVSECVYTSRLYYETHIAAFNEYTEYHINNELVFNWNDCEAKVTKNQFDEFIKTVDKTKLPENITFKLK